LWKCPKCQQTVAVMYRAWHENTACPLLEEEEEKWEGTAEDIDSEFASFMNTKEGQFQQFLIDTKRI
jgi:hypothetical protein